MLVLARKKYESFRIGESIVVTVIHCSSGRCKIGIEAPPDVRVLRSELAEFDKQNERAA